MALWREQGGGVVGRKVGEADDVGERRLSVTMVELAAPAAGDVREDAVEHQPPVLVAVASLVEKLPQEAPRLRDAVGEGVVKACSRLSWETASRIASRPAPVTGHALVR